MRATTRHFGAVVWAMFTFGANVGTAGAADTPAVLKQTATIAYWVETADGHTHPGLKGALDIGVQKHFKVNRKPFRKLVRFLDVKWSLFDRLQRPNLVMINELDYPLSSDSFEVTNPCTSQNLLDCIKIKNFPFAFGIYLLENSDSSITPHAFIYLPARLMESTPKEKGDEFWLLTLHIPDDIRDCEYPMSPVERSHCRVLRGLADAVVLRQVQLRRSSEVGR